jgi:four helix bundle protein
VDRGEIRRAAALRDVAGSFRELTAYQLARELSRDLRRVVLSWNSFDRWSIGIQLVRAAGSVGANIAEGSGRWHRKDQRNFLVNARGSLAEVEHWLTLAHEAGLLDQSWLERADSTARALNGLIRRWPTA